MLLIAEHKGDVAERARVAADLFSAMADVMTAVSVPTVDAAADRLNGPNDPRHDWGFAATIADRLVSARSPDGSYAYGDGIDGRDWTVEEVIYLLSFGENETRRGVEHQPRASYHGEPCGPAPGPAGGITMRDIPGRRRRAARIVPSHQSLPSGAHTRSSAQF